MPTSELDKQIRQNQLAKIKKEELSVQEALRQGLNPLVVSEIARTPEDYFDLACAALDPDMTQEVHPKVRREEFSSWTSLPLVTDMALTIVEINLKRSGYKDKNLFLLRDLLWGLEENVRRP